MNTFQDAVKKLYALVDELSSFHEGRPFTPDGHMVGSIGECLVKDAYGLDLEKPSNRGYDAKTSDGRTVEIKTTQKSAAAFRADPDSYPDLCVVIQLQPDGSFREIYNGPASLVWAEFRHRDTPSNGQRQITLFRLEEIQKQVQDSDRLRRLD